MQRVLPLALLLTFCAHAVRAEPEPVNLFVQWIHATNEDKRPDKGWIKIGSKLRNELSPVFQWKHFWQVNRTMVPVQPGQTAATRLDKTRKLEISLQENGHLSLMMYRDGKLVRRMKNLPLSRHVVMGGDSSKEAAWFAVVRRDKPSAD
jgi:hypothetical protein